METTSMTTETFETTLAVSTSETMTETETVETTVAVSTADLSSLAGIDVDMLNTFTYLGSAFVIGFFFFFVCKGIYRFFNMFF